MVRLDIISSGLTEQNAFITTKKTKTILSQRHVDSIQFNTIYPPFLFSENCRLPKPYLHQTLLNLFFLPLTNCSASSLALALARRPAPSVSLYTPDHLSSHRCWASAQHSFLRLGQGETAERQLSPSASFGTGPYLNTQPCTDQNKADMLILFITQCSFRRCQCCHLQSCVILMSSEKQWLLLAGFGWRVFWTNPPVFSLAYLTAT